MKTWIKGLLIGVMGLNLTLALINCWLHRGMGLWLNLSVFILTMWANHFSFTKHAESEAYSDGLRDGFNLSKFLPPTFNFKTEELKKSDDIN